MELPPNKQETYDKWLNQLNFAFYLMGEIEKLSIVDRTALLKLGVDICIRIFYQSKENNVSGWVNISIAGATSDLGNTKVDEYWIQETDNGDNPEIFHGIYSAIDTNGITELIKLKLERHCHKLWQTRNSY